MELVHLDSLRQTSVYRCTAPDSATCIKSVVCSTDAERTELLYNYDLQRQLRHRGVCGVGRVAEGESLAVEMEWAGDSLEAVSQHRDKRHWTEGELLVLVENATAALAFAQTQGVAHQNLHPLNLFRTAEGRYVLSDFAPKKWVDSEVFRIAAPPLFLCPVLRKAYALELLGAGSGAVRYDKHKSDVYSLGLIVLYCLQPKSASEFGSQALVENSVVTASISEEFKALLREMLRSDENLRPGFIELRNRVQELLTVTVLPALHSPSSVREALQLLFRTAFNLQCSLQEIPKSPSKASPVCSRCSKLISSVDWRLEYLGSSSYSESKGFCSDTCFRDDSGQPPAVEEYAEIESHSVLEERTEELFLKQNLTVVSINERTDFLERRPTTRRCVHCNRAPEFFFLVYDCGLHICCPQDIRMYLYKLTPGLLTECPTCLSKTTPIRLAGFTIYANSAYQGVFFKFLEVCFEKGIGGVSLVRIEGLYPAPLTQEFALELQRNCCHFCDGPTISGQWKCLFHGGKPSIVCSSQCVAAFLPGSEYCEDCTCPKCSEVVTASRVENALSHYSQWDSYWRSLCADCCHLCLYGPPQYRLSCAHSFCERCLCELSKPTVENYFPCLYCGASIHVSEISV